MKAQFLFFLFAIVVWAGVEIALILKYVDIKRNPVKYAHPQLVAAADSVIATKQPLLFFRSLSSQYSVVGFIFSLLLLGVAVLIFILAQKIFTQGAKPIFLGTTYIGMMAALLISFPTGMILIPLAIKRPFFEIMLRGATKAKSRPDTYRRGYLFTIIVFLVCFPFAALSLNNFCCYDSNSLRYSKYLDLGVHTMRFEDIDSVKISIDQSNNGKVDVFKYIIVCDGESIDINEPNTGNRRFTDEVFEIHKLLEDKSRCTAEIEPLNEVTSAYIAGMDDYDREIAEYIFEGFHR